MSRDREHMAAIGREGGESRSAAARQARLRLTEREVPMSITRDGLDGRSVDTRIPERTRPEGRPDIRLVPDAPSDSQVAEA